MHFPNWTGLYPLHSEQEQGFLPHVVVTTSDHQAEQVKCYSPHLPVTSAPALRYQHVFQEDTAERPQGVLGVLIPFSLQDAGYMLSLLSGAGKESAGSWSRIIIKGHPDHDQNVLTGLSAMVSLQGEVTYWDKSLGELLDKVSVIVGSGSSSLVEAAAHGCPVVFLHHPTRLSLNPFGEFRTEMLFQCFDQEDLPKALQEAFELVSRNPERLRDAARQVRRAFFQRNEGNLMDRFLANDAEGGRI